MPKQSYTKVQLAALVILRILIGWHFLYEGIAKVANPYWTSAGYLAESKGLVSPLFHWIAETPDALRIVDILNIWGLIAIGFGLIAGGLVRTATSAGMALLFLYYFANPPFIGYKYSTPVEGSYLFVNKIMIEMITLFVLAVFPTGRAFGLDGLLFKRRNQAPYPQKETGGGS